MEEDCRLSKLIAQLFREFEPTGRMKTVDESKEKTNNPQPFPLPPHQWEERRFRRYLLMTVDDTGIQFFDPLSGLDGTPVWHSDVQTDLLKPVLKGEDYPDDVARGVAEILDFLK